MMLYWTSYSGHEFEEVGKKVKVDNTIYSFDIETTSYLIHNDKQIPACKYLELSKEVQEECEKRSCMYVWQFSINDVVYYGRTWDEFRRFLRKLNQVSPSKKICFIHNLAFEFQYLKSYFNFSKVFARSSHKPLFADFEDFNMELRCSLQMSNCKLEYLPKRYNLPVKKKKGDLDYTKIRHSKTPLTKKELRIL